MKKNLPASILSLIVLLFLVVGGVSMTIGVFQPEEETVSTASAINWRERYPFSQEQETPSAQEMAFSSASTEEETYLSRVTELQQTLESGETSILGRQQLMELCGGFRRFTFQTKTDEVVLLNNGYLTTMVPATSEEEAQDIANSVIRLSNIVQDLGIPTLYVQEPQKVCRYDDEMPPGAYSDINYNLDRHLSLLEEGGVPTLDLREAIHADGLSHYDLFFRTDHHWKMSSGLWAAEVVGEEINKQCNLGLDLSHLSADQYQETTYESWYLGAQGRRVTKGYISPDDFSILTPTFSTQFRVEHPDKGIDVTGEFSQVMFDWDMLNTYDLYNQSTYEAILYGNRPLTKITNLDQESGKKILLIHDSYATAIAPFLATACGQLHMIDVREANGNFNGNLVAYIQEFQPDLVLFSFCSPVNIDRSNTP